jgi:hypothetical protein
MTECRFERILLSQTGKMIPARPKVSRSDDRPWRDFPLQVEIILQRIWELWMVRHAVEKYRRGERRTLRAGKTRKYQRIYPEKRWQKTIGGI